jgi:hypothetical protein
MDTAKINRAKEQEHIFNENHKVYERQRKEAMQLRPLDKSYGNRFFTVDIPKEVLKCAVCGDDINTKGVVIFGVPMHDECFVSSR